MLQLAQVGDWESVRRLSVQIHDLHAAWRPDIYFHTEEPYPRDQFLEDIRNRLVYVAKIENAVVGYIILAIREKSGPGTVTKKQMALSSICVEELARGHGIGRVGKKGVRWGRPEGSYHRQVPWKVES